MPDPRPPFPKKVEDWKAPWEVNDDGTDIPADDQQLDPERLKKYLHGVLSDKNRLQATVTANATRVEELERSIAEAPDAAALTAVQTELAEARRVAAEAAKGPGALAIKYEIALEKGLTINQAKRLIGQTREEIEADADTLVEELGIQTGHQQETDETGQDPAGGRLAPRTRFVNPVDPKANQPVEKVPTPDEVFKAYMASR